MIGLAERVQRELLVIVPKVLEPIPPRVIGRDRKVDPRTAKDWKRGACLPQASHLMALELAYPEMRKALRRVREAAAADASEVEDLADRVTNLILERMGRGGP